MSVPDSVPRRIKNLAQSDPDRIAIFSKSNGKDFHGESFKTLYSLTQQMGAGLKKLGVNRGEHVGLISDNRREWLISDLAILGLGAADVPRGSDSTADEIDYILRHAECQVVLCENHEQKEKITSKMDKDSKIKILILLDDSVTEETTSGKQALHLIGFSKVLEMGQKSLEEFPNIYEEELDKTTSADVATLIYTSGTTGEPKGVILTHHSFLFQMDRLHKRLDLTHSDVELSVLPIWHSFERAVEYIILGQGGSLAYSKPIGKILLADMAAIRPTILPSVPRIWESVMSSVLRNVKNESSVKQFLFHFFLGMGKSYAYFKNLLLGRIPEFTPRNKWIDRIVGFFGLIATAPLYGLGSLLVFSKIKKRLGGRFRAGVSGGGALPEHVDLFFHGAGIRVLEGYGLTETGPVLSVRDMNDPVFGTVGALIPDVHHRVVGENGKDVGPGEKGVLWVKSPQVMEGYYKRPEATAKVLKDGWLNTGDLVRATVNGEIKIIGREKDTIVLLGGENIEPEPIEGSLLQSTLIEQVMVVGQDQKFLGALVVPNMEALEALAAERSISYLDSEELIENAGLLEQIHEEIQEKINAKNGFKAFEKVLRFHPLASPFDPETEMTKTLKLKRNVIAENYAKEIKDLFK